MSAAEPSRSARAAAGAAAGARGDHPRARPRASRVAVRARARAGRRWRWSCTWSRTTDALREPADGAVARRSRSSRDSRRAFERAFADRFGGRDALVRLHHGDAAARVRRVEPVDTVMRGTRRLVLLAAARTATRSTATTAARCRSRRPTSTAPWREFARRRDWLAARGIAYVVASCRRSSRSIPSTCRAWVAQSPQPTPLDRVRDAVRARRPRARSSTCARRCSRRKARERVYYQTDSHWNFNGAVVGYDAIMRAVQRRCRPARLPPIAPAAAPAYVPGVDFYSGDLVQMLGLPRAHPRGRRRAARQGAGATRRAAARGASTRASRPGFEYLRLRPARAAARRGPARLDGDPADPAAVGELQPRRRT